MSQLFGYGITCKNNVIGFYNLTCINSTCENCVMKKMFKDEDLEVPKHITYYQFVTETYEYYNKSNVLKVGTRTVRRDNSRIW